MSRFEYLSVLVSIVIALGITEVTISWGRLLQQRARVRFSGLHGFWSAFSLILMVQFWWGFWNFRTVDAWSLPTLLAVIVEAVTLVLCVLVLTPRLEASTERLDLRAFHAEHRRPFFLLGALLIAQLTLIDVFVVGAKALHPENGFRVIGIGLALTGAALKSDRAHVALTVAASVIFAGFVINAVQL